jgi:hypothetical protein
MHRQRIVLQRVKGQEDDFLALLDVTGSIFTLVYSGGCSAARSGKLVPLADSLLLRLCRGWQGEMQIRRRAAHPNRLAGRRRVFDFS